MARLASVPGLEALGLEGRLSTVGSPLATAAAAQPAPYPRVSVVIPAYNEAENLQWVLDRMPSTVWEVVLVDGGSADQTVEVAQKLRPDVRVLTHPRRGKGNALATGFAACTGDIIVMLDADGSADPQEIPRFVEMLMSGADFAKGTRFADGGGSDDLTRFRHMGNSGLVALVNLLYRTQFTDLCYGLNAFWRHCLPHVNPDCDGFEVETFMNLRIAKSGLRVEEVGSFELKRIYGLSKLHSIRDGLRILRTILRERILSPQEGDLPPRFAGSTVALHPAGWGTWKSAAAAGTITVALVNNMPDGAFLTTDEQFQDLISVSIPGHQVLIQRYLLPGTDRHLDHKSVGHLGYRPVADLYGSSADALVITGTEPLKPRLMQESYWKDLEELLTWGVDHTKSMLLSCLAAHAAVQIFDGVERSPRPSKCFGVRDSRTLKGDPLVAGLPDIIAVPHSHWNEVSTSDLVDHGYRPILTSESDWTAMAKVEGKCQLILCQGHPEYGHLTLLREFRRDWRRFHEGASTHLPQAPRGYLNTGGWLELQRLEGLSRLGPDLSLATQFPFGALADHIRPSWHGFSQQLYANWLTLTSGAVPVPAESVPTLRPAAARI